MIIDESLGKMLAHESVVAPFRQIRPMRSDRFAKWLSDRGIELGSWTTLHYLWQVGVLHSIAVCDVTWSGVRIPLHESVSERRLVSILEEQNETLYADLGLDVDPQVPLWSPEQTPSILRDSLLWHPFQLWAFANFNRLLSVSYQWSSTLRGPDAEQEFRNNWWRLQLQDARQFAQGDRYHSFQRLVALLLAVEPLVHSYIYPMVTLDRSAHELHMYLEWVEGQDGAAMLNASGLSLEEAVEWHRDLSISAELCDPVARFRKLLRHADHDEREKLKGRSLRAHTMYDTAEVLRRYLERYHECSLPEETYREAPERVRRVNIDLYGSERPADYQRHVLRRIVRRFELDPGYRIYCYLEGLTEIGYLLRWAAGIGVDFDRAGVCLVNLRGKDNIAIFRDELERLRDEEIFTVVYIDLDNPGRKEKNAKQVRALRKFESEGLLVIPITVWNPNFVQHNFTIWEVWQVAQIQYGAALPSSTADVEHQMRYDEHGILRPFESDVEKAIDTLSKRSVGRGLPEKGLDWGGLLADWSLDNSAPKEISNDGVRPIDAVAKTLLRGGTSNYPMSLQRWRESQDTLGAPE
ncbi:MAG: hypothetical protein M3464_07035 [Chloroflexota bacterium]|nr:hypothetical protein [Chloroflexota bacterium]